MSEELNLVRDLAVILISAGIFTIISKALKQPLILGYIIAGFLIGPNIDFFPGITSQETVHQWSEIGIIFLMFGLGLEFSFKKLMKVGSSAIVTALLKFVGVFIIGFVTAQALSWSAMESIFLGGLLSMSSTMVVIKSFDDMGLKNKSYAGMVFGTLVVEDLIAILLMVLLSTMAVSQSFAGKELFMNIAKLVFFLLLWFLIGIFLIPTVLNKAKKFLSSEILLIVSIGLCFSMVALATAVGFSSALGAFVMGSILAETTESENIDHIVEPIKNLFGAIFFVSVGMMLSPSAIAEHWALILLIVVIVIVTHILFAGAGIMLTGNGLYNAVHTGFSLAQLGEFGFILAGVGCTLGVMRDFIYPVIIAVSVITTFTTPYMMKLAGPTHELLQRKLPPQWLERLSASPSTSATHTAAEESEWKKLLSAYFTRILLYGVIVLAIYIGSRLYLRPLVQKVLPNMGDTPRNVILAAITLLAMTPFLFGMGIQSGSISKSAPRLLKEKPSNIWPLTGLVFARSFLVVSIILGVLSSYFHLAGWTVLAIIIAGIAFIFFARRSMHRHSNLERRFLKNYNEREENERRSKPVSSSVRQKLSTYDVRTEAVSIAQESSFAGMQLKDLPLRDRSGANIIKIQRGSISIIIPSGDVTLYPGDRILAVGTTDQLERLRNMVSDSVQDVREENGDDGFRIEPRTLTEDSFLTGKTLRTAALRKYQCMVISLLRGEQFITNPEPDLVFQEGDTVWIAGNLANIEAGWAPEGSQD
ncbi:MAG: cation:proton antiporter [Bacteroidales bacterium]|nr:cation:proton antiporter [Bacteroidales bacterium]